jgi:cold shock CspA family protein
LTGEPTGSWPTVRDASRRGVVTEFDDERGLGVVTGDDGCDLPFHCTEVLDGSRFVEVGTPVLYVVAPGHLGRLEARAVRPVG